MRPRLSSDCISRSSCSRIEMVRKFDTNFHALDTPRSHDRWESWRKYEARRRETRTSRGASVLRACACLCWSLEKIG
eukprot:scaffold264_cov317-Pinguiococcus_pyrenoidosus.AAC.15